MKNTPPDPTTRWESLLHQARPDTPPPTDLPALLRAIRSVRPEPQTGWADDLVALFAPSRAVPACLAAGVAFALFASWQVWDTWQALPWAQLLVATTGGVP